MGRIASGADVSAPVTYARSASSRSLGALGAVVVLLLMGLGASSALATTGHNYAYSFGTPLSNANGGFQCCGPYGITILQSTGDVFASDPGHLAPDGATQAPRIERFDSTGSYQSSFSLDASTYVSPTTLAVDPTGTPHIYVAAADAATGTVGAVLKYTTAGAFIAPLDPGLSTTFPTFAAIGVNSTNGDVYVGAVDSGGLPVIDRFDSGGTLLSTFDGSAGSPDGPIQNVTSLAVDGSNRLYVLDAVKGRVDRYSATGTFQLTVDSGTGPSYVTADPTSSQVYVLEGGAQITAFTAGGAARNDTFGAGHLGGDFGGANAVAVNHASGAVYAADGGGGVVRRFTTFVGPTVTTDAAAAIDAHSETLNGTINPGGTAATFHFEYGLDQSYGTSTTETSAGSGNAAIPKTDTATALTPNTLYHVRLVGSNDSGTIYGNDQTFTTNPAPPTVDGTPALATALSSTGATLNGTVNTSGSDTTVHYDYRQVGGSTYTSTTDEVIPAGTADAAVAPVGLTGLTSGTNYEFHVVASNGTGGTVTGTNSAFWTGPATAAGATSLQGTTATLSGTVNPHSSAATYHFEYGLDTSYGTTTTETSAGAGSADQTVTAAVAGLTPGTTYHVRVVATNGATSVTTTGVDGTFTTSPAPGAVTGAATGVTTDHATVNGTADTHGLAGTYQFLVDSSTSPFQFASTPQPIDAGGGPVSVSTAVADLPPGGTYGVRLAVKSAGVLTVGDEVTFSTAPLPVVIPPPTIIAGASYGCAAPALTPYNGHPKPGDTIKIAGSDLGVGGTVMLGTTSVTPANWSATGFELAVPDDATGTLALTVNCGTVSNTIAIATFKAPSNTFTATGKVKGRTATLSVKVPGAGSITVTGGSVNKATKYASKSGTTSVKVSLSSAGKKSVKRHKTLSVSLTVRFTPTGGTSATKTVKVTFKK